MGVSIYIIPALIISLILYAIIKKVNIYNSFTTGASKALKLVFDIFPFVVAMFIMIEVFQNSSLSYYLSEFLSPLFKLLGIPKELIELTLLRPFTGSGSLALISEIYSTYGVDSYIGRTASVIMGSSETVFYVSAVYFSKTKVKKLGYVLPLALIMNLFGVVISCLICRIM